MQSRRTYRIVMTIVCFLLAGLNAYKILTGEYEWMDVFILVVFLVCGSIYLFMLLRGKKAE